MAYFFISLCFLICIGTHPAFADSFAEFERQTDDIIQMAPFSLQEFLADPAGSLFHTLFAPVYDLWKKQLQNFVRIFLYLLVSGSVVFCLPSLRTKSLLEWSYAAGTLLFLTDISFQSVSDFCAQVPVWKNFLFSFSPIFSTMLTAYGHPALAVVYNGFFLSAIQLFAFGIERYLLSFFRCFLALSVAGVFSCSDEISAFCRAGGKTLKKLVRLLGVIFTAIIGLQRTLGLGADSAARQAGQGLISAIPIVGQTLSAASGTVLSALSVLRTSTGFAAIAVIAVEFVPLWFHFGIQLFFLHVCSVLCRFLGLFLCGKLFDSTITVIEAAASIATVFCFMIVVTTAVMLSF